MDGIQQTFTLTGTKGASARVTVTENYDLAANTSALTVAVELAVSTYYGHTYYLNGSVAAGGQTLQTMDSFTGTHYVTMSALNTYYPVSGGTGYAGSPWSLGNIAHNTDGSKTVTVSVSITGEEPNSKGADGFTVTGSKEIQLTHIPRASTIAATDADIGAVSMVAVSKKSSGYTHSVAYSFGGHTGYVTPEGLSDTEVRFSDASVAFRLPDSFYSQIPNAKTGICTLTCRTYSGTTQIGDTQSCSFTATASENACAPAVSGMVTDTNSATAALTGNSAVLVRYMSTAYCTISATARNGASITEKSIAGVTVTDDSRSITGAESGAYAFAAADSRGYSANTTVVASMVPYVRLTCNPVGKRDDPTSGKATLTVTGDYYNGSFGAADNAITLRCRQGSGSWVSVTPTVKNNTYTESFSYTVQVSDKLSTVTKTLTIDKGIPVFDWGEDSFNFHVPVRFSVGCTLKDIGITAFPTTMKAIANAMPANSMLSLDSRLVVAGGDEEISDLGLSNAGMYLFFRGYSNARLSLLNIYGSTSAGGSYANFGCYAATDDAVWWILGDKRHATYLDCRYRTAASDGVTEWVNPPMVLGTEYRTTERWNRKVVYTKLVHYSGLPNNNIYAVAHGAAATQILRCAGMGYTSGISFPSDTIHVYADKTNITIRTTANHSSERAYVQIWYTKD